MEQASCKADLSQKGRDTIRSLSTANRVMDLSDSHILNSVEVIVAIISQTAALKSENKEKAYHRNGFSVEQLPSASTVLQATSHMSMCDVPCYDECRYCHYNDRANTMFWLSRTLSIHLGELTMHIS